VELLVVIAIIVILVALLLPAVQSARESARRAQCTNHLKQIGLGLLNHESATRRLPSGGWGHNLMGDPDRGSHLRQPGGWCYALLPFLEQQSTYEIGHGMPDPQKKAAMTRLLQTVQPGFICPSRRSAVLYRNKFNPVNSNGVPLCAKSDYAGNAGYVGYPYHGGTALPSSLAEGDDWIANGPPNPGWFPKLLGNPQGVIFMRSDITIRKITDGTSKTLFIGEKYLRPEDYETGNDAADNESMYAGFNNDIHRSADATFPPLQDTLGFVSADRFGSAHAGVYQAVFCDGSVRGISYEIDSKLHSQLGKRADGQLLDTSGL
jgi:hypothetical protein